MGVSRWGNTLYLNFLNRTANAVAGVDFLTPCLVLLLLLLTYHHLKSQKYRTPAFQNPELKNGGDHYSTTPTVATIIREVLAAAGATGDVLEVIDPRATPQHPNICST